MRWCAVKLVTSQYPKVLTRHWFAAGHSVGTQNYTSTASSTYKLLGAMANFFLQNGTTVVGQHFFLPNGAGGFNPVFTKIDASVSCLPRRTHTFRRAMRQP